MWNLVLCVISGILLGILFSLERSSPLSSKFDYDEKVLERVIRNDILLKDALEKITETNAKVEHTLARIIEENANAEVKLKDTIHTLDVKRTDLDNKVEVFINSAARNVSVTVDEMKAYIKSLVSQTDNDLKAKTRNIDEKVDGLIHNAEVKLKDAIHTLEVKRTDLDNEVQVIINSASQQINQHITNMTSAARLLVERTASELDIIKAQSTVALVNFQAVLNSENHHYKTNDNVVFNKVMANDGGGYDPVSGFFTAPVAGVYISTVQYCPYDNSEAGFEIVREGIPLQRSAHKSWGRTTVCVNMQVVAKVAKGARVWVRTTADDSLIYPEHIRWNSFSGLLIHAKIVKH